MAKDETINELAWRYHWEQYGNTFILTKANGEFVIAEKSLIFVCSGCSKRTVIKTGLTLTETKNIIKGLGYDK